MSVRGFQREGKSYATVAIGCTGGRHRSVAIAKELGRRLGGEVLGLDPPPRHPARGRAVSGADRGRSRSRRVACVDWSTSVVMATRTDRATARRASGDGAGDDLVGLVIVTHGGSGACLLSAAAEIVGVTRGGGVDRRRRGRGLRRHRAPRRARLRRRRLGRGHPHPRRRARLVGVPGLPRHGRRHAARRDRLRRQPAHAHQARDASTAARCRPPQIADILKEVGKRSIRLGSELTGKIVTHAHPGESR